MRSVLKVFGFFLSVMVVLWFVLLALMPFYGFLRPWPEATQALKADGIDGIALMIGGGTASVYNSAAGGQIIATQRSYIVVPDSFRHAEIFTCEFTEKNGVGQGIQVLRAGTLIPLGILWLAAGAYSVFLLRRFLRRKSRKSVVR